MFVVGGEAAVAMMVLSSYYDRKPQKLRRGHFVILKKEKTGDWVKISNKVYKTQVGAETAGKEYFIKHKHPLDIYYSGLDNYEVKRLHIKKDVPKRKVKMSYKVK